MTFKLDPRLKADGLLLAENHEYVLNLANDSRFPWVILIPKVSSAVEVYQLAPLVQQKLAADSAQLGEELMELYQGDCLNTGKLGNIVRQLHLHHIVRFNGDDAWPGPIWGSGKPVPYSESDAQQQIALLRKKLSLVKTLS